MIKTAVVGASGYTGLELIKILVKHSAFELSYIYTRENITQVSSLHPSLKNIIDTKVDEINIDEINKNCSLVFLATPHTTSMQYIKQINKNIKIVDLSADYRLSKKAYEENYTTHIDSDNLQNAIYGLPEIYRKEIKNTNLVANPGCYPTASLLGIFPFIEFLDTSRDILIDAKSGVSGAGKTPNNIKHFVSVNESLLVYSPLSHRHEPEIQEVIQNAKKEKVNINFTPTLIPITRGMQCNIYLYLKEDIDVNVNEILNAYYKNEYFIRITDEPTSLKNVCGTNFCDIYAKKKNNMVLISTSIDNLLRGASSQAVVNANIMFGLDEKLDIPNISYMP